MRPSATLFRALLIIGRVCCIPEQAVQSGDVILHSHDMVCYDRVARLEPPTSQAEYHHATGKALPPAQPPLDGAGMRFHDAHLLCQGVESVPNVVDAVHVIALL